ncbi:phosphoglycerate mutase family protein [Oesophagostomum dentatum]|uniref:Phosphoglycerate mutase family protein n=1 Tax=Oesophagostomum dentatum TaxID=61180 RepID=A0A0B1SX93_OESDE|nr:phosphoglycerate mutase family protein [Oesophagostomum dentatum]
MTGGRVVWVVRHAEREDNINKSWRDLPAARDLGLDNPMLSERGRRQCMECAARFRDIKIAHVFASPYDRTIETASIIVAGRNLLVKPELGLCESLHHCTDPPGFWDTARLKKKYPLVDAAYVPIFSRHTLPKVEFGDYASTPRIRSTLISLTEKYSGDLLLVSHGAPIACVHKVWHDQYFYVGQASVTKFVEVEKGKFRLEYSADISHLSDKNNLRPW